MFWHQLNWCNRPTIKIQQALRALHCYGVALFFFFMNVFGDINEIKQDIVFILERLDYEDGSWDSIRYVKGGKIDKRRN